MEYIGDVYRPPSEAYSFIYQLTIGCSHNQCTFCTMYKKDKFRIKNYDEVLEDILSLPDYYLKAERVFIADGDALIVPTEDLIKVIRLIKQYFPRLKRIGIYASPRSIFTKSLDELKLLKSEGLGIVYLGMESGSSNILRAVHKGVNQAKMIEAGRLIKDAGLPLSVTLISGLGGVERTQEHSVESAAAVNAIQPDYLGLLSLMLPKDGLFTKEVKEGRLTLLSPKELLLETRLLVENCELENTVFRSNHASNYVSLSGTLNKDKNLIINQIDKGMEYVDDIAKRITRRF